MGIALVGLFQGCQHDVDNGLIIFRTIGAQLTTGRQRPVHPVRCLSATGWTCLVGVAVSTIVLGIVGLLGFAAFMIDVRGGGKVDVGLFERLAVYPIVLSQPVVSISLLRRWPPPTLPCGTVRRGLSGSDPAHGMSRSTERLGYGHPATKISPFSRDGFEPPAGRGCTVSACARA